MPHTSKLNKQCLQKISRNSDFCSSPGRPSLSSLLQDAMWAVDQQPWEVNPDKTALQYLYIIQQFLAVAWCDMIWSNKTTKRNRKEEYHSQWKSRSKRQQRATGLAFRLSRLTPPHSHQAELSTNLACSSFPLRALMEFAPRHPIFWTWATGRMVAQNPKISSCCWFSLFFKPSFRFSFWLRNDVNQYETPRGNSRGAYAYTISHNLLHLILRPHRCKTCRRCDHEEGSTAQSLWHWGPAEETELLDLPSSHLKTWRNVMECVHVAGRCVIWVHGGEAICNEFGDLMSFSTTGPQHRSACFAKMSANCRIHSRIASFGFWSNVVDLMLVWDFYSFLMNEIEWISVKYVILPYLMQRTGDWVSAGPSATTEFKTVLEWLSWSLWLWWL